MSRVVVLLPPALIALGLACGSETRTTSGGPAPPPGAGYGPPAEDIRTLSRDDCLSLRDHQIEIAVAAALGDVDDQGKRLEVEAKLRGEHKAKSEDWVKKCSGKSVPAKLLRCWKEATTPASLVACETPLADAAVDGDARD